ncbi:IclR family transcriptional regulator [Kocuria sp. M1R5S2]|uniref:IclR family transcriptional regulator n=1 Tax=Kocuria rhizosphaerae TaxID=3376285 RepID=UPI00378D6E5D
MTAENDPSASPLPQGTRTLARGLDVLRAIADGAQDLKTVTETTGIGRSTAHRLIQMLELRGFVRTANGRSYTLGPQLIDYGYRALSQIPLPALARPVLERLAATAQDTVHLAVEDAGQVFYLDKISGTRGAEMRSRIGHRMPLTTTGIGKSLLLDQPERWADQYAAEHPCSDHLSAETERFLGMMQEYVTQDSTMDLEENEPGIRCVAAPVRDARGLTVAAISVSATQPYMPSDRMQALVPVVRQTAQAIGRELGRSA